MHVAFVGVVHSANTTHTTALCPFQISYLTSQLFCCSFDSLNFCVLDFKHLLFLFYFAFIYKHHCFPILSFRYGVSLSIFFFTFKFNSTHTQKKKKRSLYIASFCFFHFFFFFFFLSD